MKWTTFIFSLFLSSVSLAVGTMEIDPQLKKSMESKVSQTLGLSKTGLVTSRIGNSDLRSYNFNFGKLTKLQFQDIRLYYSLPLNPAWPAPGWDPMKNYQLSDFLLPKMQAPMDKTISKLQKIKGLESISKEKNTEVLYATNCYSTAYDILRSDVDPLTTYVYIPNDKEAAQILRDPKNTKLISQSELKPYDLILYLFKDENGEIAIDHAAISLGMGLTFEKSGDTEVDAYTVSNLAETTAYRYRVNEKAHPGLIVEYRRQLRTLPNPLSIWSAKAKKTLSDAQLSLLPESIKDQIVVNHYERRLSFQIIRPLKITRTTDQMPYSFDPKDSLSKEFISLVVAGIIDQTDGFSDATLTKKICATTDTALATAVDGYNNAYLVDIKPYMTAEPAQCLDVNGKAVTRFWIPANIMQSPGG